MESFLRRFPRFRVHPLSWCAACAVLALFVWLNLDRSCDAYLAGQTRCWRGGVRLGFPVLCWDAGLETRGTASPQGLSWTRQKYGGVLWLGLAANLAAFAVAVAAALFLSDRAIRALANAQPAHAQTAVIGWLSPASRTPRATAIRPLTAAVAAVVLGVSVALNLTTDTDSEHDGRPGFCQTMGWPFETYIAGAPDLPTITVGGNQTLTPAAVVAYLENHPEVPWRLAHWDTRAIVLNAVTIMVLVIGSACACEAYCRRRQATKGMALADTQAAQSPP